MAKRKSERDPEDLPDAVDKSNQRNDEESDSDEDMDVVNVDFEWFDPQPAVDFHGIKTLLRQLLDVDSQLFDLSELADIILSQPLLGSTVKVDGNETDPYAFLTVLNLETHKDKKSIQDLTAYLSRKSSSLLPGPPAQIGLILTERFINMPHEIVPPMYTMLLEEIQWALEEKEPYSFTHYLVLSKRYTEIQSALPSNDAPPSKKKGKKSKETEEEVFYFHPEDEVLQKHAVEYVNFEYDTPVDEGASDSKRAFQELGVKPKGHLILIEAAKFENAVQSVKKFLTGQ
ncbi:Mss4p nuclear export [Coniothyrium glycines]